jgi:RNA polymerase sigma-70 factor (ECF subfamily)
LDKAGWPAATARQTERELHARLLDGDPVASSDLFELVFERLVESLQPRFPRVDRDLIEQAVAGAVAQLALEPGRYQPERSGLLSFLRLDARGDLLNELEKLRRRARHETSLAEVELPASARNRVLRGEQDPAELTVQNEAESSWRAELDARLTPMERVVAELMIEGERRTAVFAQALGIVHLSQDEQRQEVKRVKDRLKKRLRRRRSE